MIMMNDEIESIFQNFQIDEQSIPVSFMFYDGDSDEYIVYSNVDHDGSYAGDDEIQGCITYYDFEIYSKKNYRKIMNAVIDLMKDAGWQFQPSNCSSDQYDRDTKTYSKTLCFSKHIQFTEEEENDHEQNN